MERLSPPYTAAEEEEEAGGGERGTLLSQWSEGQAFPCNDICLGWVSYPLDFFLALFCCCLGFYLFVCAFMRVYHMCEALSKEERVANPLGVDVQTVMSYLTWMLEITSAGNTLNC